LDSGDLDTAKKMAGRSISVTREMTQDAKTLMRLMGVPVIESPSEAEA
jgi:flap endonuclease-1